MGFFFKLSLKHAKKILTQNRTDSENLKRTLGCDSIVIPNAHRISNAESHGDTILWVGRSAKVKCPEKFIALAQSLPEHKFTMICHRSPNDKTYDALVQKAAAVSNLQFIRSVPFSDIGRYFASSRVLVNTSDSEGFPNTFIQAGSLGVPVISLNADPDNFLKNNQCGLCCDGNMEQLKNAVISVFDDAVYHTLGRNIRRYILERHSIEKVIAQYKKLFTETICR